MAVDVPLVVPIERVALVDGEPGVIELRQRRVGYPLELPVPAPEVLRNAPAREKSTGTPQQRLVPPSPKQPRALDRLVRQRPRGVEEELAETTVLDLTVDGRERVERTLSGRHPFEVALLVIEVDDVQQMVVERVRERLRSMHRRGPGHL